MASEHGHPLRRGILLAACAAGLFGVTAPLLARASAGIGSLWSSAFLYLGAALSAGLLVARRRGPSAALRRSALPRLATVAALGAVAAPTLLVLGLARTDAASASLLLALEAPFTLLLARLVLGEYLGRRVVLAAALILAGAFALAIQPQALGLPRAGAALVAGATFLWALDNLLSRTLADRDPIGVVAAKGTLGALFATPVALLLRESLPPPARIAALVLIGALGFGVSLQLYLRAQTLVGAARTASVFAAAPFVGAVFALALGSPWPGWTLPAGALLMSIGVALHLSERHSHPHTHEAMEHEHLHTHDDGHHHHVHDPMPLGPHSHPHRHDPITHEHEHSEDLHHRHTH